MYLWMKNQYQTIRLKWEGREMPGQLFCFEKPACFLFWLEVSKLLQLLLWRGAFCKEEKERKRPSSASFTVWLMSEGFTSSRGLFRGIDCFMGDNDWAVLWYRAAGDRNMAGELMQSWADGGIRQGNKNKTATSILLLTGGEEGGEGWKSVQGL